MPNINIKWAVLLKSCAIITLIMATTFIAYHEALNNGFLKMWDTYGYIVENTHIHALTWENIQWMFTNFYATNWHPLTWLSHAIDYAWFGLEPRGHHLVNIIIHGFNSILVFGLVIVLMSYRFTSTSSVKSLPINNEMLAAAGIAAIWFAIHPQHVESVAWVAERKDVLCLFFILLASIFYVFYHAVTTVKTRLFWYLATLFSFILALLAKPMAVTFPVVLLLLDVYPLNRTSLTASQQHGAISNKLLVLEKIPFFVLTLGSIALTLAAQSLGSLENVGMQIRILNAFNTLIVYISKFIFPISLSPFYPLPSYTSFYEYYTSLIPVLAAFFITFICGYLWYKKKYYWLITWLFYLVTLAPVIGIVQVGNQAAADRYVYLPTIPFYILFGIGIARLLYNEKLLKIIKLAIIGVVMLITSILVLLTQEQTLVWRNDLTFWDHVVAYEPESALARFNLGTVYFFLEDYETAIRHYHVAVTLEPDDPVWQANLPVAYMNVNRFQAALDILNYWIKHQVDVGFSWEVVYYRRGLTHFKLGQMEAARQSVQKALEINSDSKAMRDLWLKITKQPWKPKI